MERVIDWLRTQVERLLQQWADAAERKRQEQERFAELEETLPVTPPPPPPLEESYRRRFKANAADVGTRAWEEATDLITHHVQSKERGLRSNLEDYRDDYRKPAPTLPHCLQNTTAPPPADEPDSLQAIAKYVAALPSDHRTSVRWTSLKHLAAGVVERVSNRFLAKNKTPEKMATAIREELGQKCWRPPRSDHYDQLDIMIID